MEAEKSSGEVEERGRNWWLGLVVWWREFNRANCWRNKGLILGVSWVGWKGLVAGNSEEGPVDERPRRGLG